MFLSPSSCALSNRLILLSSAWHAGFSLTPDPVPLPRWRLPLRKPIVSETSLCVTSSGLSFSPTLWFQAGLGLQQSSWVSVLSAGLQIWVTKASKQTHSLWTPFCYIAPLIQVSSQCCKLKLCLTGLRSWSSQSHRLPPARRDGRTAASSSRTRSCSPLFYHFLQAHLRGHSKSASRSFLPKIAFPVHVLLKPSVDSI